MSGVRPEWIAGNDFIMLHLDLVDALDGDYEAAMVLDRIRYRSGRDGWWSATADEMRAETRLSEWKLKAAIKTLRTAGMIESERVSSFDPTQRWRLVMEETSVPCGMETSDTGSVREESSVTVREESSVTSSKNLEELLLSSSEVTGGDPERHPSRPMASDWNPSQAFRIYLRETYPRVNISDQTVRFRNFYFANQTTSRSWEARFENWVSTEQERAEDRAHHGTDDMGIPLNQRATSVVPGPAQPGDENYFNIHDEG